MFENRPCHLCGQPRGEGHINPEMPGKVLCATCAGATPAPAEPISRDALKVVLFEIVACIDSESSFDRRRMAIELRERIAGL